MKIKLFALAVSLFAAAGAYAQTRSHEIGLQSDNDSFLAQGSDRYYTNGIFAYYRKALDASKNTSLANKVLGFEVGQKLFNPQSAAIPSTDYLDRPFAGYLYAGASLNLLYKNESALKLTARLGVVGPAAGGKGIQEFIHKTFGFYPPDGWQYQIRNDVEVNLSADYSKLIARGSWIDVSAATYANLGTGFISAGAGPLFRFGNFNQLFQSASTQSTASKGKNSLLHEHEFFLYYKPQANVIGYDATIQGSIFKDHPEPGTMEITKNIRHFVFSNEVGANYVSGRFVYGLAAIFNTKDVKNVARSHQWGSATLLYRFN
ncbi:lipid A deacylase LpxR family protein [Mucilaginibacter terrenus]|uniref:Lipid A deacylase LpxR family protein n=1 Tax=Mucilaginibacter terrenus TaxID=2482727 RepID=A0A3E2NXQ9_9SPHI|nr:lipid A deacylase LpxR family protein [Mucilaginibacter terrenus]RFZ85640.1 lipid A deacylase LpxR family protein [Mucilaginibacter terrenus]